MLLFQLIYKSVSSKEAYKIMLKSFEGYDTVKMMRLNHLPLVSENIKMTDDDYMASFSDKLSSSAHDAFVLGINIRKIS